MERRVHIYRIIHNFYLFVFKFDQYFHIYRITVNIIKDLNVTLLTPNRDVHNLQQSPRVPGGCGNSPRLLPRCSKLPLGTISISCTPTTGSRLSIHHCCWSRSIWIDDLPVPLDGLPKRRQRTPSPGSQSPPT